MLANVAKARRTETNRLEVKNLNVQQTAEMTAIGRTLVFGLIKDGKLRSLKIGSRRIVTIEAIEEFIAQQSEDQLGREVQKGAVESSKKDRE
jgi:excisionase family DNA binding protein